MVSHCYRHDLNYSGSECPRCIAQAHQDQLIDLAEKSEDAAADRAMRSDYNYHNPGDYKCPHCNYITLKLGATRCPKCQGGIDQQYRDKIAAIAAREAEKVAIDNARWQAEQQERQRALAEQQVIAQQQFEKIKAAQLRREILAAFLIAIAVIVTLVTESNAQYFALVLIIPLVALSSYYLSSPPTYRNSYRALIAATIAAIAIPLWRQAHAISEAIRPHTMDIGRLNDLGFLLSSDALSSNIFLNIVIVVGFFKGRYIGAGLTVLALLTFRIVFG